MHKLIIKIFTRAGWVTLGLLLTAVVLVLAVRVVYQYVNTVTGSSTVIAYEFTPKDASFKPIFVLIDKVAQQNGLQRNRASLDEDMRAASWSTPDRWFGRTAQKINFYMDASPHDEPDGRKLNGHISIGTGEADEGNGWQLAAKKLETALAHHVRFNSAHVQLDSRVYGLCASKERPAQLDTTCVYPLEVPVDFDRMNSELLQPRVAAMRPR